MLIGALLFGYFLTITQSPQKLTEFLTGLGIGRYGVLALIMLMYLVLGCLMDAMAMIILTVPIIFPVIVHLGFDPIWFGVIIVMTVELGLIHPPVGMNVFVIKSVVKDVSFTTIFKGVLPFIPTDILRLVILIAFPIIALWLPHGWVDASREGRAVHDRLRREQHLPRPAGQLPSNEGRLAARQRRSCRGDLSHQLRQVTAPRPSVTSAGGT